MPLPRWIVSVKQRQWPVASFPPVFVQVKIGLYSSKRKGQCIIEAIIGELDTLKPDDLIKKSLRHQPIALPSLEPSSHSLSREHGKKSRTLVWQLRPTWLLPASVLCSLLSQCHLMHRTIGSFLHVPCGSCLCLCPGCPLHQGCSLGLCSPKGQTLRQGLSARSVSGK